MDNNGEYRGLVAILKDLNLINDDNEYLSYKLPALREILNSHPAFDEKCALEQLATLYNIKIIWCPKFHCELNPIEGEYFD